MPDASLSARLAGVFLPITTPFDPVTGETAPVAFRDNLRRWTAEPIDGIVLFGSTGEGALLDEDEKVKLTGFARDVVPAGLPLIAGAGAESTRSAVRQARSLAAAGADAVLVHPPPYFGATLPAGALRDHYRRIADESPVPLIIYHMPKYTHVTLDAGLVGELTRHPNVAGLKDSSGDLKRFADYTDACSAGCRLFVGNGTLVFAALELGAAGGILAIADVAPAQCVELVRLFRAGEKQRAGEFQERLAKLHRELVAAYGAVGVKAALDLIGYTGGPPRQPLRSLPDKDARQVARVMQEAGLR